MFPGSGARLLAQAERIFFETAHRKTLRIGGGQAELSPTLVRQLRRCASQAPSCLPWMQDGNATGYLAGCPDSFSPASQTITGDIYYFTPSFCAALKNYPSHFHINVKPGLAGEGNRALACRAVRGDLRGGRLARHSCCHWCIFPRREILRSLRFQAGDAICRRRSRSCRSHSRHCRRTGVSAADDGRLRLSAVASGRKIEGWKDASKRALIATVGRHSRHRIRRAWARALRRMLLADLGADVLRIGRPGCGGAVSRAERARGSRPAAAHSSI